MNFDKHLEWMSSPEGRKSIQDHFQKINRDHEVELRWFLKFQNLSEEDKNLLIEKIWTFYRSDKYVTKWYKRGYEPPTPLLFVLHRGIAAQGDFFSDGYKLTEKYSIERVDGQGSYIHIFENE